jgi:amino-acid racemase
MKHAGILAHGVEGATACLLAFCREGVTRLGPHDHPAVTLDCTPLARSLPALEAGDHGAVRALLAGGVARLAAAGAEVFACPNNTAHAALETTGPAFALPGLHIAEVVAERAAAEGRRRVGILGTRYTMGGPVYPRALSARGIECVAPSGEDGRAIDEIIFRELVNGVFTADSRAAYVGVIGRLRARGCDAVALVCTEIPLLVAPGDSPLPTLDSTRLLARALFEVATGTRPMPSWRGGPVAAS